MPLIFSEIIDRDTKIGVWEITEAQDFFSPRTGLPSGITHPQKRLQHMAGRYLLTEMAPSIRLQEISISSAGKPLLTGSGPHFSVSHCRNRAAVIVSDTHEVGVDVEYPNEKIRLISHKFLLPEEKEMLLAAEPDEVNCLTMAWSIKESMFKWHGRGGVDFRNHLHINSLQPGPGWWSAACTVRRIADVEMTAYVRMVDGCFLSFVRSV